MAISDQTRAELKRIAELITKRDDLIRLALEEGATVAELCDIFDLTRQRIYQIRDRRR